MKRLLKSVAGYSLRSIFAVLTAAAVILAVAAQVPRPRLSLALKTAPVLAVSSLLLAMLPLAVINFVCWGVFKQLRVEPVQPRISPLAPWRLLTLPLVKEAPKLRASLTLVLISTLVTAASWPALREFGLGIALWINHGFAQATTSFTELPRILKDRPFLHRLFNWEAYSLLRWWLFFGALAMLWIVLSWPLHSSRKLESAAACLSRLLSFGAWLVLLDVAFMVGVWTTSSLVVPEPATGFVEGIFSWDLWHWDCWRGRYWIVRWFVPTFVVTSVFFRYVLRWRTLFALPAAACAVPAALTLSVAWSVLYSDPGPWLRLTGRLWRLLAG
jgi:hypothetical protein